jgi:hypothetical protein
MSFCRIIKRPVVTLFLSLSLTFFTVTSTYADAMSEQEIEDWFNDDSELSSDDINEGQLTFIAPLTDKNILATEAVMTITDNSLITGMVSLRQCYRNLDPVAEMDVVYSYKNMKQLRIVSVGNIAEARVIGNSIQLQDVTASAFICVAAEVQLLENKAEDFYVLSYGPYYRRFLDGYYPYHATVIIDYPEHRLRFADVSPSQRPMFEFVTEPGKLIMDTWFEGVLQVNITFSEIAGD